MTAADRTIHVLAADRHQLVTREEVLIAGGSDRMIARRIEAGRWYRVHPGVFVIGVGPLSWEGRLRAATLAVGPLAAVSHRAAVVLWGLDGISSAPVEITVPHGHGPVPAGAVVHRTRRREPTVMVRGVPVTSVERTVLDAAGCLSPVVAEKVVESAVRRNLTTVAGIDAFLGRQGGRGVRGAGVLRELLGERTEGRAPGSPAEVELVRHLRLAGIEPPVRQHEVPLPDGGVAVVDLAWPSRHKLVEVDGVDAHATAAALEADVVRQNQLLEAGYDIRRFSARAVRRHPDAVVAGIRRFLRAG